MYHNYSNINILILSYSYKVLIRGIETMENMKSNIINLKSCALNDPIKFNLNSANDLGRILNLNIELTNLCPNTKIGVNIKVYCQYKLVAMKFFYLWIPCNTYCIKKCIPVVLMDGEICKGQNYSVVVIANEVC